MADDFGKHIDPGNEVSKAKPHTLPWLIDFLRKHPEATLARGEAALMLAEIDRLQAEVTRLKLPPDHADGL
jgi:hypothetical protein